MKLGDFLDFLGLKTKILKKENIVTDIIIYKESESGMASRCKILHFQKHGPLL